MVCAHRACRIRNSHALDSTGIIGRHSLALHYGDPFHSEGLAGHGRAIAEDPAEVRALADLLHHPNRCICVPKLGEARLHGDGDRRAHLDRVNAVIIIQEVEHGNFVKVTDAAVSAVGPNRLVLWLLGEEVAILVIVSSGALDHAAPGSRESPAPHALSLSQPGSRR